MKSTRILLSVMVAALLVAFAPPARDYYYTIVDGDFTTNGTWSDVDHESGSCECHPGCTVGNNEDAIVAHAITTTCTPLEVTGSGNLIIVTGGSLVLPDNANLTGNGDIVIEPGATLYVSGDLNASGNGTMNVDGDLIVVGDINTSGSADICGTGTISYGGSINGSGVCGSINTVQNNSLPVELLYFTVSELDDQALVQWGTASEKDNDFFTIERSQNGATWELLTDIQGAGNSSSTIQYEHEDMNPLAGTSYYRLTQTDFDGAYEVFAPVAFDFEGNAENECVLSVNPNPCTGNCQVVLSDCPENAAAAISVKVFDAAGNVVESRTPARDFNGGFRFSIDRSNNLKPGVYFIAGASVKESYDAKVIVQ